MTGLSVKTPAEVPACLDEEWRGIPGWPWYEASSEGRIRSLTFPGTHYLGKVLSPAIAGRWKAYLGVRLWNGDTKTGKTVNVHNLIMLAFVGPPAEGMEINHKNGESTDNRLANLEYVTHRQNEDHAVAHGLHPRGERHHAALLTEDQVRVIRGAKRWPGVVIRLATSYGVSRSVVKSIREGKSWKHVKVGAEEATK